MKFSAKMKISASKSATSPSCKSLATIEPHYIYTPITMIEKLHEISESLWIRTKVKALICIENYLKETDDIHLEDFPPNLSLEDFDFEKDKQSLIFCSGEYKTNIIRTTYFVKATQENKSLEGFYSLDFDENNEMIDEWLSFK